MSINEWAGEIVKFLLLSAVGIFLLISSGSDLIKLYTKGVSVEGYVISTHVDHETCGRTCARYSYVKVPGRSDLKVPFKLTPKESYKIMYLPGYQAVVTANTWSPLGNNHMTLFIGFIMIAFGVREALKLKQKLRDVNA